MRLVSGPCEVRTSRNGSAARPQRSASPAPPASRLGTLPNVNMSDFRNRYVLFRFSSAFSLTSYAYVYIYIVYIVIHRLSALFVLRNIPQSSNEYLLKKKKNITAFLEYAGYDLK